MRILVIGAGMYVTGREGSGVGTVLSSLAELSRKRSLTEVTVAATRSEKTSGVADAVSRINRTIGASLQARYRQVSGNAEVNVAALCETERFDCAIVSVPDHLHYEWTGALLRKGINVLVVKPLTPTLAEAKSLVSLQAEAGLYGAVEFHKRFDATNLYVARMLAEAKLGKILYFTVDYSQKITIPLEVFNAWSGRTNIFQYLGVHYVDLIYFLTGFVPVRAMAIGTDGILRQRGIATYDSVHAAIVWQKVTDPADWFVSQFATNWIDPACTSAMSDQKYKVIGTRGRIECDQKNRGLEFVQDDAGIQQINPYFSDFLSGPDGTLRYGGYGHESISLFINDVADLNEGLTSLALLEKSRPTFSAALVSTAVIDAVNLSLADNFNWKEIENVF